jgi:hypothetical protein
MFIVTFSNFPTTSGIPDYVLDYPGRLSYTKEFDSQNIAEKMPESDEKHP